MSVEVIMGDLTFPANWQQIEGLLIADPTASNWHEALNICLTARLRDRYLEPIENVRASGTYRGEGFLILTVQCSVIEFLASLRLGYNYRYGARFGENFEYGNSNKLFSDFLIHQPPFGDLVKTAAQAQEFYADIRCALVHEAQTKNGWKVWGGTAGNIAIDFNRKYVNRDLLQVAIDQYLARYRNSLVSDAELKDAFVRKFRNIYEHDARAK